MNGMLDTSIDSRYDIIKKWANKSKVQKEKRVNKLIDDIVSNELPYDIIEDAKFEAQTIAEMLIRNERKSN